MARSLALEESFRLVEAAPRYRGWVLDQARPWLGRRLLEVGCGVGNYTADLLDREVVVAIDPEADYLAELSRRLGHRPCLRTLCLSMSDPALGDLAALGLDTALVLNVLEHVGDDVHALRNLAHALGPDAAIVLQVPAHPWLAGAMDRALGHRRRYSRAALAEVVAAAGLDLVRLWQFDAPGVLAWGLNGLADRRPLFPLWQMRAHDALVPLIRALEPRAGVPLGLSMMAVARTRDAR